MQASTAPPLIDVPPSHWSSCWSSSHHRGLIGILLPTLNKARQAADRTTCLANLHQIGIYLQVYQNRFNNKVPIYTDGATAALNYIAYADNVKSYVGLGCSCRRAS
jgi:hypothetical protein